MIQSEYLISKNSDFYCLKHKKMKSKLSTNDNKANQQNPNKGTAGTNKQYNKVQGNRGKQMNQNQGTKKGK